MTALKDNLHAARLYKQFYVVSEENSLYVMYFTMRTIAFSLALFSLLQMSPFCLASDQKALDHALLQFAEGLEGQLKDLTGCAVALISEDKVIYKAVFGDAQLQDGPLDADTLFALASVSKPIVAASIALLVDQQKLTFEDTVTLPYLQHPLQLAHFLNHTTGYAIRGDDQIESGYTRTQLIDYLNKQKPQAPPGELYTYSNLLYSLVDEALQTKGFSLAFALANFHKHLGKTISYALPLPKHSRAHPYDSTKHRFPFPSLYQQNVVGAAGLFSSLNGVIEFMQVAMGNRPKVLSRSALDSLYRPRIRANDVFKWSILPFDSSRIDSFYSLGWRILTLDKQADSTFIFHSGFINGARTCIGFVPAYKVGFILLISQTSKLSTRSGLQFWKTVLECKGYK